MELITLKHDVHVFGFRVSAFPAGIASAFDLLIEQLNPEHRRSYYGISECTTDGIVYLATAEERYSGESERLGYQVHVIPRGRYCAVSIVDWADKTHQIKNIVDAILKSGKADTQSPCIEWYRNDKEMWCMVKAIDEFSG